MDVVWIDDALISQYGLLSIDLSCPQPQNLITPTLSSAVRERVHWTHVGVDGLRQPRLRCRLYIHSVGVFRYILPLSLSLSS